MTFRFFIGETEYKEIPMEKKIEITKKLAHALGYEVIEGDNNEKADTTSNCLYRNDCTYSNDI